MRDKRTLTYWFVALAMIAGLQLFLPTRTRPRPIQYSELVQLVRDDKVAKVELRTDQIVAELKGAQSGTVQTSRLPGIDETSLVTALGEHGISFSGRIDPPSIWASLMGWVLPLIVMFGFYYWLMRRMNKGGQALSFGRSRAKIHDASQTGERVSFGDVAGVDEAVAELGEIVDFLRNPDRYRALGAHVPRGVLLVGAPGTGKTLLARAVAGEASVPFFSITGSDFVEMFVGVGAARVRDLFAQAKERAPCIVFIDEIDALGRSRGGLGAMATHDEREQTLNQLLAEMDGFDTASGVVLIAATNRPEILDPALLRAGRFDRQVVVDRPDVLGREAILKVHARTLTLGSVDLTLVARRTAGMVGADLANVANEAALAAARRRSTRVEQADFEEAVDRLQLGPKKRGHVMNDDERRRVALHEAGHALVARSVHHADPVHRVTILPRSIGALGATLQLPTEDRYLATRAQLRDRICVALGGRVAEEIACGDISTGAENDLEQATLVARQMITRYGMSEELGLATVAAPTLAFLPGGRELEPRACSEDTSRQIDLAVRTLLDDEHARAFALLAPARAALDAIAQRLLEVETLDAAALDELLCAHLAGVQRAAS